MADPWPPDLAALNEVDRPDTFGPLEYHAEVDSTNDVALVRAAAGAQEGTAVLADRQRAGRGRWGRTWFSPPGAGVYLSVVIRPPQSSLSLVTLAAGVAASYAVTRVSGLSVGLKWPNDLVVGRGWHKLGGVLCEAVGAPVGAVVVGVGINLRPAAYPPTVADRATSIEGELGRPVERAAVVVQLLAAISEQAAQLRAGDRASIRSSWLALAAAGSLDGPVRWEEQGSERRGFARDIDDDGALLVESEGERRRIVAGEVQWDRQT